MNLQLQSPDPEPRPTQQFLRVVRIAEALPSEAIGPGALREPGA